MQIRITVTPGARKEKVEKKEENVFYMSVREKAERGEANARVREIVAEWYSVPVSRTRLVKGHRSPNKVISIAE